jgi:asparagine synthase (glutamine-hydrolysing)
VCGIAGKVSSEGAVPTALVEAMCSAQAHRGPDSSGTHTSDGCCLGIQRLAIIDLETGDQPIYNEDRSVAVVLNGEIYNYRELREQLHSRGHSFSTQSDTEVISHLYEEKGADFVDELRGMFAVAIWDVRRQRLVLARDRVGKKPLFYACGDGWLSFASELTALLEDPEIPTELDPASIDCYLAYGYIPAPWSIWRDVRKLPPAHTLIWEQGKATTARYWQLDYTEKLSGSSNELEEELRRLVGQAVRRRMISDVPLGAFLSGGVDSSIVVSEMAAASSRPVKTFSIGFENERYNELPRARAIAKEFATDHEEFIVRPNAIEILPQLVRHYGEPYADSSAVPTFYLAELTRRHVTVALNGDGGDEDFGGYLRHVAGAMTSRADLVPISLRRALARAGSRLPAGSEARGVRNYARRLLSSLDRSAVDRYADHVSIFNSRERDGLLDPEFREQSDPLRPERFIRHAWFTAPADNELDTLLSVDVNAYLPYDLLVKVDTATMAHSLEARSPLLDQDVMEFAAALPTRAKVLLGRKKWLLRRAYRDRVPARTLRGRKRGFAVPLDHWFRNELRDYTRESLLDRDASIASYLDRSEIERTLEQHQSGAADGSAKLWALLMLETWHAAAQPARIRSKLADALPAGPLSPRAGSSAGSSQGLS